MIGLIIDLIILFAAVYLFNLIPFIPGWLKQGAYVIATVVALIWVISFLFGGGFYFGPSRLYHRP